MANSQSQPKQDTPFSAPGCESQLDLSFSSSPDHNEGEGEYSNASMKHTLGVNWFSGTAPNSKFDLGFGTKADSAIELSQMNGDDVTVATKLNNDLPLYIANCFLAAGYDSFASNC